MAFILKPPWTVIASSHPISLSSPPEVASSPYTSGDWPGGKALESSLSSRRCLDALSAMPGFKQREPTPQKLSGWLQTCLHNFPVTLWCTLRVSSSELLSTKAARMLFCLNIRPAVRCKGAATESRSSWMCPEYNSDGRSLEIPGSPGTWAGSTLRYLNKNSPHPAS